MRKVRILLPGLAFAALIALASGVRSAAVAAEEGTPVIVYVNGAKYYVHTVAAGETLYSLSKRYGTTVEEIVEYNPTVADGLKPDVTLKIPVKAEVAQEKKKRRDYEYHTVAAGETLYSIAHRYSISVETVMADNPTVDPSQLAVGTRLYIRKSDIGSVEAAQVKDEWESYRDNLNTVAPDGYEYHIVQAGETVYSLSRRYGMTEEELLALNALPDGLKAGGLILVPSQSGKRESEAVESPAGRRTPEGAAGQFEAVESGRALQVALLLPMTRDGAVNNNYVDFYRGFLMGAEHLKLSGRSVELTLFDTEQRPAKVAEIVAGDFEDAEPDIIIGPVYENTIAGVLEYAEAHNIPVVSPLAALSSSDSRVLFQMAPDAHNKYDKAADLFDGSREITLIYGTTTDREFEREVMPLLAGRRYSKHKYVYQHPSRTGSDSANDLSDLLRGGSRKVFVIMSDNETEVDRILAAIASADISLRSRERTACDFAVLGNTHWNRFPNLDRAIFFTDRVVMPSSYAARRENERVEAFDEHYIKSFDAMPTPYAYRGYDAAVIFGEGMFGDIENSMTGVRYAPLQTGYTFGRAAYGERMVNTDWPRMNYRENFTITVE